MLKNFFKTTLRSLSKNKGYSFLNIAGLTIGIACAGLIFLWVEDETNFDNFNVKKDRLYIVKMNDEVDAGVFTHASSPIVMATAMQADLPGIENTCRTTEGATTAMFSIGDKAIYSAGMYADPSLFSMFTLPFKEGDAKDAFTQLYSIVLTQKTAKKFFGDDKNIVGKTVRIDQKQDYIVTGVLADLPPNSSLQFEWLAPFQIIYQAYPVTQAWSNFGTTTYVELKPGVNAATIDKQLYDYIQLKQGDTKSTVHAFLFGMNDWRLYDQFENGKKTGGGRIQYVRMFSIIAWIILFIACINFMNLATARSEKRAREVGVRKVMGAGKPGLIAQFIGEALLMALLAAVAAAGVIFLLLPAFDSLVQKDLSIGIFQQNHIMILLLLTLICGLVAGSYPSLYLSSFNPVFVLKGLKLKSGSASFIRKGLVVLQFTVSIVLIIGTIIIYQQIKHIKSRDLGYNKSNLVQMNLQGDMLKNFTAIKQDLINTNAVETAALADHETISGGNNTTAITWPSKPVNSIIVISQRLVTPEFIATTGMHLLKGRDFVPTDNIEFEGRKPKYPTQIFNVVISESMEKLMGRGSALGKTLQRQSDVASFNMQVVGVVKDYVYGDMYGKPAPVILYCIPQACSLMYVRTKAQSDPGQALAKIAAVIKKDNPGYPFEYKFVDDQFNAMFQSEMLISKLSGVFASLAIIISCLGLFGLAAYTTERRTKEIGIRKVLGASVSGITTLLSKDFMKLVVVACVVAFPVAWYMMHNWLQNYEYHVTISWWIFLIAGATAILIALLTVSFQAIKGALTNPVQSFKTE